MSKMLAVVFSGIGYHGDKPLLYYSSRLARKYGYEIKCAEYGPLPSGVKGDAKKMYNAYELALESVSRQFREVDFSSYRRVLFLSKSMGTAVAATFDAKNNIGAGHVFYTPVEASFRDMGSRGIVFHGTADDWAETDAIRRECEKRGLPLFLTKNANHSMETGDVLRDLEIMREIMQETEGYIERFTEEQTKI